MNNFKTTALAYIQTCVNEILDYNHVEHDANADPQQSIIDYFSWLYRWIPARPRTVTISTHLTEKLQNGTIDDAIVDLVKQFQTDFEKGVDMISHLSKLAKKTDAEDYLRYHWSIYHLHLANNSSRSNKQLLAAITPDEVLFVDVIDHPARGHSFEYFNVDHLRIIRDAGWFPRIRIGTSENIVLGSLNFNPQTGSDFYKMYKDHMNVMFELDGVVYGTLNSVNIIGDPMDAVWTYKRIVKQIDRYEGCICNDVRFVKGDHGELIIEMNVTKPDGSHEACELLAGHTTN